MQNQYVGDIGDFVKFGLLRTLGRGHRLGIAWYLFPDQADNGDGKHIGYLNEPDRWRHLDPELFDGLRKIVVAGKRSVRRVETCGLLPNAAYSAAPLDFKGMASDRRYARKAWFQKLLVDLQGCSIVFADPDNGLCEDTKYRRADRNAWKRIPLSEALKLAADRPAVVYHHNSRHRGGHVQEIQEWLGRIKATGADALALYWRPYSQRTLFVIRATHDIDERLRMFERKWASIRCKNGRPACELHGLHTLRSKVIEIENDKAQPEGKRVCPECGHVFQGNGWDGIDVHWKARHKDIMPYSEAWQVLKKGGRPSDRTR